MCTGQYNCEINNHLKKCTQYLESKYDKCGECVESMGVASGCGYQGVGVASWWNLWAWLVCVVIRRWVEFMGAVIRTEEYAHMHV